MNSKKAITLLVLATLLMGMIPIVSVQAITIDDIEDIRNELGDQLMSTVRWTESVHYMRAAGIDTFIELGPKDVLSGLLKRIDRSAQQIALNSVESVEQLLNQ